MADHDQSWARDFFGPLWAWVMIGVGLLLMASAYGLHEIGVPDSAAIVSFSVGVVIVLVIMFYLFVEGWKIWRAWF